MNTQNTDSLTMQDLEQKISEAFNSFKESICEIEKAWVNKIDIPQDHRRPFEEKGEDKIQGRIGNPWNQMDFKQQKQLGNIILDDLEKARQILRGTMQKLDQLHETENKELQTEEIENLQIDIDDESFDFIGGESERNNGGGGVHEDEDAYICKDKGNNMKSQAITITEEGNNVAAATPSEIATINITNTSYKDTKIEQQKIQIHLIQEQNDLKEMNPLHPEQLDKKIENTSQLSPQQQHSSSLLNKPTQLQYQMLLQQQQRQFQLLNQQLQSQQKETQNNSKVEQNHEEPLDTIDEECPSKEIFQLEKNYSLQIKSLGFMAQVLQCKTGECFVFAKYGDFNTLRGPFSKQGAILLFEDRVGFQRVQLMNQVNNQTQQKK